MRIQLGLIAAVVVNQVFANQWVDYAEFECDATNAIENIGILMSDSYTNKLYLCRCELAPTNEMSSAALLMLALSDDAKSTHIEDFVGNTNALAKVSWFLTCPSHERTLWQRACAITMLSTANKNPMTAVEYFNVATNALQQWDANGNCFSGGALYQAIAGYFGAAELNPRMCLVFAAATSAKEAGMEQQFNYFSSLLPPEAHDFLTMESW